jgi:hypothetical protein
MKSEEYAGTGRNVLAARAVAESECPRRRKTSQYEFPCTPFPGATRSMRKYGSVVDRGRRGEAVPFGSGGGRCAGGVWRVERIEPAKAGRRHDLEAKRPRMRHRLPHDAPHRYAVKQMADGAGGFGSNRMVLMDNLGFDRRDEEGARRQNGQRREQRPSSSRFQHSNGIVFNTI